MTADQAMQTLRFLKKYQRQVPTVVVQCEQGPSWGILTRVTSSAAEAIDGRNLALRSRFFCGGSKRDN